MGGFCFRFLVLLSLNNSLWSGAVMSTEKQAAGAPPPDGATLTTGVVSLEFKHRGVSETYQEAKLIEKDGRREIWRCGDVDVSVVLAGLPSGPSSKRGRLEEAAAVWGKAAKRGSGAGGGASEEEEWGIKSRHSKMKDFFQPRRPHVIAHFS